MWLGGLGSSQTDHLSTTKGKGGGDEDGAEAFEAIFERAGILPVSEADVSSVIAGDTADIDDDGEDDEATASCDLDAREDEFDFTITSDTEDLDPNEEDQEDSDPNR